MLSNANSARPHGTRLAGGGEDERRVVRVAAGAHAAEHDAARSVTAAQLVRPIVHDDRQRLESVASLELSGSLFADGVERIHLVLGSTTESARQNGGEAETDEERCDDPPAESVSLSRESVVIHETSLPGGLSGSTRAAGELVSNVAPATQATARERHRGPPATHRRLFIHLAGLSASATAAAMRS